MEEEVAFYTAKKIKMKSCFFLHAAISLFFPTLKAQIIHYFINIDFALYIEIFRINILYIIMLNVIIK